MWRLGEHLSNEVGGRMHLINLRQGAVEHTRHGRSPLVAPESFPWKPAGESDRGQERVRSISRIDGVALFHVVMTSYEVTDGTTQLRAKRAKSANPVAELTAAGITIGQLPARLGVRARQTKSVRQAGAFQLPSRPAPRANLPGENPVRHEQPVGKEQRARCASGQAQSDLGSMNDLLVGESRIQEVCKITRRYARRKASPVVRQRFVMIA